MITFVSIACILCAVAAILFGIVYATKRTSLISLFLAMENTTTCLVCGWWLLEVIF